MENRPEASYLFFFTVAITLYIAVAFNTPNLTGYWQDDAIYLATAKSLTQGSGYRHIEMPSEPLQTKYPILYPAVLSFFVSPDNSGSPFILFLPTVFSAALFILLSLFYFHKSLEKPGRVFFVSALLLTISPVVVDFVRFTMSDLLYAFFSIAALVCLERPARSGESHGEKISLLLMGSVCIACCILTRGVGISLLCGALLFLVVKGRYRDMALVASTVALIVLPWFIWLSAAKETNGPLENSFFEAPELSYSLWLPESPIQSLNVIKQNIFRTGFSILYSHFSLPLEMILYFFENRMLTPLLHIICYFFLAMIGLGILFSVKRGFQILHLYLFFYLLMILAWPFEPGRFLIPWTPFILFFFFWGLEGTLKKIADCIGGAEKTRRTIQNSLFFTVFTLLMVAFIREDSHILSSTPENCYMRGPQGALDTTTIAELDEWIKENTEPEDIIASVRPASIYLNTGRQGVFIWPDSNPYKRYYGKDRTYENFYSYSDSQQEIDLLINEMDQKLISTYRDANISYYVEDKSWAESFAASKIALQSPAIFRWMYTTRGGEYRVYKVEKSTQSRSH